MNRLESAFHCSKNMLFQKKPFSFFGDDETPKSLLKIGLKQEVFIFKEKCLFFLNIIH